MDVDVLLVGAGPATLAAALHLKKLFNRHNQLLEDGKGSGRRLEDPVILVVEKGKEVGAHALSGAVVDPQAIEELIDGIDTEAPPYESPVVEDALYILTKRQAFRSPITPPPLQNHGCFVASLGKLVRWLAGLCEAHGVDVLPEFPAAELLLEGNSVRGVRIGDKGRDREGKPKANFEPGIEVFARATVLGEGPRGTLSETAIRRLGLSDGKQPQLYAVGVKEIWQVPGDLEPGVVYHTMGFPLGTEEFGGGFIYSMQDNLLDIGMVVGLDHENPQMDCHRLLQQFKTHPWVREMLEGGKPVSYGAKAIPEGGYYAMPRLYADGLLIVGDSAGFLNSQRLKGIHLAVWSGMMAAETIFEAFLKDDFSASTLRGYQDRFEASGARRELWRVRNFRQSFQSGFWRGMFHAGLQYVTGGRGLKDPFPIQPGHARMKSMRERFGEAAVREPRMNFDGELTLDKLSALYLSDTAHEEDQPAHLKVLDPDICDNRCTIEYGNPCRHFCPANVYEILHEKSAGKLQVNFSNCVHCKTCEIMDPYQIIRWTTPEGGGGPDWKLM